MIGKYDREGDPELAQDCEDMAEVLHEKGKHELADALEAVAAVKRGERTPGGSTPDEPEPEAKSTDELLEAVERGELTAAEAREQLADQDDTN